MTANVYPIVEVMRDEPGPPIVIVDFAEFSAQGALADLISSAAGSHLVCRIDPVTTVGDALIGMTLGQLADVCVRQLRERSIAPAVIVGYCSAAALALHIVAALRVEGVRPAVVLVEPSWVTPDFVAGELANLRRSLHADDHFAGPFTTAVVLPLLRADLVQKLRTDGLTEEDIEDCADLLIQRYAAWLGFLLLTLADGLPAGGQEALAVITGADSRAEAPPGWRSELVSHRRLEVATDQVAVSTETVSAILAATDLKPA